MFVRIIITRPTKFVRNTGGGNIINREGRRCMNAATVSTICNVRISPPSFTRELVYQEGDVSSR